MSDFNDIGISRELDWPRIKKLLTIGLFASVLHLAGDLILGWGVEDDALEGVLQMLSAYTSTSDSGLFAAALLGLFGVVLEGLACFGVYRLMAAKSPKCDYMICGDKDPYCREHPEYRDEQGYRRNK